MAIIQPTLEISQYAADGISTGEFVLSGGVVRNASNMRIVEHAKDVTKQSDTINEIINFVKEKAVKIIIIGGTIVGLCIVGEYVYNKIKNKENENNNENLENEIITNQNELTNDYINEIQTGTLDKETLINLILNFKKIIDAKNKGLIIDIDIEKFNELLKILDKYTNELAKANNINLNIDTMNSDDYLLDCVKYLECQKQIFEMCELESEAISK